MARRVIVMDEVLEVIYQGHKGQKIAPIKEKIAAFHKEIEQLLKQGVSFKQIWRLIGESGTTVGYTSLKRYIHCHFEDINQIKL